MVTHSNKSLFLLVIKRVLRMPFLLVREGRIKFLIRKTIAKISGRIPAEFLVNPGDVVVLIGFHRIDSVMLWSYLVGGRGKVLVIEAVPSYIDNIRTNLERHLNWPIRNITYVSKGVDAIPGTALIQVGRHADYNKISMRSINDGLTEAQFEGEIEIQTDTVDNILRENTISSVNHVHMTISGMECEALKGMEETLLTDGLRVYIRSLHIKDGKLLYPQVVRLLEQSGMKTAEAKRSKGFKGRDIYGARL